jgi:hypothetical protein
MSANDVAMTNLRSGVAIRTGVAAAATLTLALSGFWYTASAATAPSDTDIATRSGAVTAEQQQAVDRYWTPDRMRLAGALVPEITPIPPDDNTPDQPTPPPADRPDPGEVWRHGGTVNATVGRLFFTFDDGYDGSCTATAVDGANRGTIVTAAHCLRGVGAADDASIWNHNEYFVPGYRNATKPYGGFSIRTMVTSAAWNTAADSSAAALAGYDAAVGWQTLAWTAAASPTSWAPRGSRSRRSPPTSSSTRSAIRTYSRVPGSSAPGWSTAPDRSRRAPTPRCWWGCAATWPTAPAAVRTWPTSIRLPDWAPSWASRPPATTWPAVTSTVPTPLR